MSPRANSHPRRAVIFANGELNHPDTVRRYLQSDDLLIAADGGARHMQALGISPHVLIGDFDSLSPQAVASFETEGVESISHPAHKDYTDLELALRLAAERGVTRIFIFAAVGARWDQTLANLLLPAAQGLQDLDIRLIDGPQEVTLLVGGNTLGVQGDPGDTVSLIPIGGAALGVTTQGLEYPLVGERLDFGATRGISNVLLGESGSISLEQGALLCVTIHTRV